MNNETQSLARAQATILRREVTTRVADILRNPGRYRWGGTMSDLLELVHGAYVTGAVTDDEGFQLPFAILARRVFEALSLRPVSNPYARARRAEERKGMRSPTLACRILTAEERGTLTLLWQRLLAS